MNTTTFLTAMVENLPGPRRASNVRIPPDPVRAPGRPRPGDPRIRSSRTVATARRHPGAWPCLLALLGWSAAAQAAPASPLPPTPAPAALVEATAGRERERGAHHQIVDVVSTWRGPTGAVLSRTNPITVLGTGLFYREGDRWLPSREEFELTPDAVVAQRGPHRLACPRRLEADGCHEMVTADGRRFRWRVLGLSYHDPATGRSVWIARCRESSADLVAPNKLVYRDAFSGIRADLMFEYTKAAFAQDVVLRAQLPSPAAWGLTSDYVRLEVVTEFVAAPEPTLSRTVVWQEPDPARAASLHEPSLTHDRLEFGAYRMAPGQLFWVDGAVADPDPGPSVPVLHRWQVIAGRTLLFEHLEYETIRPLLQELPPLNPAPETSRREPGLASAHQPVSREAWLASASTLPDRPAGLVESPDVEAPSNRGLVLDWTLAQDSPEDVTFRSDTTYLIAGVVNLGGTVTFEGGTVIKYTNTTMARINLYGDVVFRTAPYLPAVLTANADDSVGEVTPRGPPSDYYAQVALQMPASNGTVAHVRIARARTALYFPPSQASQPPDDVRHVQLVNCLNGIVASGTTYYRTVRRRTLYLGNALLTRDPGLSGPSKAISGAYVRGTVEHVTLDGWDTFAQPSADTFSTLVIRNSVFAQVKTTAGTPRVNLRESACNGFYATPGFGSDRIPLASPPFVAQGGARHYLAPGTGLINRGTNTVDATLRDDLRTRTVNPPLSRSATGPFARDLTLGPTAARDDDERPDLGWHYAPLDWCWSGLTLAGTNGPACLLLTNGVAVGIEGKVGTLLLDGARFVSEGSPTAFNRLVRSELVQEQPAGWTTGAPVPALFATAGNHPASKEIWLRFTEIAVPAGRRALLDSEASFPLAALVLRDCRVLGASLTLSLYPSSDSPAPARLALTNTLFRGATLQVDQDTPSSQPRLVVHARQNRFEGGVFRLADYSGSGSWGAFENEFDTVARLSAEGLPNSHNAYTGDTPLPGSGGSDVLELASSAHATASRASPQGSRAVSRDRLVDAGSRSAAEAGLYHYRTGTSTGTEGNTTVDIGYHDMVLIEGRPPDTDGDGLPDYLEDANGNGLLDDRTSWTDAVTTPNPLNYNDLETLELTSNILVTDPAQEYANEQNTQYQPTIAVVDGTVVVGFWDTGQGLYGLASRDEAPGLCRMVAYSVSHDGGRTFADRGVPPIPPTASSGDAGDPVLAVDRASGTIYYAATSERRAGAFKGIPLWKSVDRGTTFVSCPTVREEIEGSDYPWIVVDDWPGPGQHDVYALIQGYIGSADRSQWLTVSRDGNGESWSQPIAFASADSVMPQMVVGTDHTLYISWSERTSPQSLQLCTVTDRGTVIGPTRTIVRLKTTVSPLRLRRSNLTTEPNDWFKAFCLATIAVNPDPARANHLYVTFADQGAAAQDRADVYFVRSTNGGEDWTTPVRVPLDSGVNDQWNPVIAVRPDGNALFIGWNDRRNDPLNSRIEVHGRWARIESDGAVGFLDQDFRISSEAFPPAFSGAVATNAVPGHYDPVWPPGNVNLNWWYPWFPEHDDWGDPVVTSDIYSHETGEFNSATADAGHVYMVWADNRERSQATRFPGRHQADIRLARLPWPKP